MIPHPVQSLLYLNASGTGDDIDVDMAECLEAEPDIDMEDYIHGMYVVIPWSWDVSWVCTWRTSVDNVKSEGLTEAEK